MANLCSYVMKIVSDKKENVDKVMNLLNETNMDKEYIGGRIDSSIYEYEKTKNGRYSVSVFGDCAWSIWGCLFGGEWTNDLNSMTIVQASKKFNLDVEIFSQEPAAGFAEHYLIKNGDVLIDDDVPYYEYPAYEYETKEALEKDYGVSIPDEKWEGRDEWISIGGYDEDFTI